VEDDFETRVQDQLRKAQADAEKFTRNDQAIKRKDTVEVVMDILTRIKQTAEEVNKQPQEVREKLYHVTFNATVIIYRLTRTLREAAFSKEATHFLAFNVLCLDNNLILTTAKYLDWRVMNYVELSRAYADLAAYKAASRVVSYGVQKVLYLKQIEEQDPPVPDGTKETLVEALRVLRTQELKYQL
jgi:Cilia- and flagella-associated protein 54